MIQEQQERTRKRVVYTGRVQGVGFRFTTTRIARRYPITGYVRNEPDGAVELVVDGCPEDLHRFLADVDDAFRGNISSRTIEDVTLHETFTAFEIR